MSANTPQTERWTVPDVLKGIERLKRLTLDVKALADDQVSHDSGRVGNVELAIERTVEVYLLLVQENMICIEGSE